MRGGPAPRQDEIGDVASLLAVLLDADAPCRPIRVVGVSPFSTGDLVRTVPHLRPLAGRVVEQRFADATRLAGETAKHARVVTAIRSLVVVATCGVGSGDDLGRLLGIA